MSDQATRDELLFDIAIKVELVKIAVTAILTKANRETQVEFMRAMNAALGPKKASPENPRAARMAELAAEWHERLMPDVPGDIQQDIEAQLQNLLRKD